MSGVDLLTNTAGVTAPHLRRWTAVAVVILFLLSWFGGCTDSTGINLTPAVVKISPDTLTILTGQSAQLTATVWDANGKELHSQVVTWATRDPSVATVSGTGLVTAVDSGRDTITASSGGQTGVAVLDVRRHAQPSGPGILVSDLAPKPTPQAQFASVSLQTAGLEQSSAALDSVTYVAIPQARCPTASPPTRSIPPAGLSSLRP